MQLTTSEVIRKFDDAFHNHDATVLSAIVADRCVLENTGPVPDGATYKGHAACVEFWTTIANDTSMRFETENIDILDDRAIILGVFFGVRTNPNRFEVLKSCVLRAARLSKHSVMLRLEI